MTKPLITIMKKKVLSFLLAFATLFILGFVFKDFISAYMFNTYAVTQATSPNITIDAYPPDLIVDSPANMDYATSQISIRYSVSDSLSGVDTVWYNTDGGRNTTLTGSTSITASKGDHILYIYARDKAGLVNDTEFVTFSVL